MAGGRRPLTGVRSASKAALLALRTPVGRVLPNRLLVVCHRRQVAVLARTQSSVEGVATRSDSGAAIRVTGFLNPEESVRATGCSPCLARSAKPLLSSAVRLER